VRLVWTYSKDFKKGNLNNHVTHEYIEYLFKKSITEAPNVYTKIMYTDSENVEIFKNYVDDIIVRKPKPFVFLADLKFDVAEILNDEFIVCDGDLFLKNELVIPKNKQIGFEMKLKVKPVVYGYKKTLIAEGIVDEIPLWGIENKHSNNLC
jgi:hypothetical protein